MFAFTIIGIVVVAIAFLSCIIAAAYESTSWITTIVLSSFITLSCMGDFKYRAFFDHVVKHPWLILVYVLIYIVAGVFWAYFKWFRLLIKVKKENEAREGHSSWREYPTASDEKNRIIHWLLFWPTSILVYTFKDLVSDIYTRIYMLVGKSFDKMSKRIVGEPEKNNI